MKLLLGMSGTRCFGRGRTPGRPLNVEDVNFIKLFRGDELRPGGWPTLFTGRLRRRLPPDNSRWAAVDIGAREIKMLQLQAGEAGGGPVVTAYGRLPAPAGALAKPINEKGLTEALLEIKQTSGIQTSETMATISGEMVFMRHVKLPVMPDKDLVGAVYYETEKSVSVPVEELTIRYLNLGVIKSRGEKFYHLLLVAVPTSFVYEYYGIFAKAGLTLTAIDLPPLSLWRVFSGQKAAPAREGTVGIFDIGAAGTQFVVVRNRELLLTGSLPVGGDLLTWSLAEGYGIGFREAQQMKEDKGELFNGEQAVSATVEALRIDSFLREGLAELLRELRKALDYHASQENAMEIERFIISGGTSKMKGFRDCFAAAMGKPVDFGYSEIPGLSGDDSAGAHFDPAFAVVLGTALREVGECNV